MVGLVLMLVISKAEMTISLEPWTDSEIPFECKVDGIFPHMNDCEGSYNCTDGKLKNKNCPSGTQFDPVQNECTTKPCKTPDCSGKIDEFVKHPGHYQLYVRCVNNFAVSMHSCPADKQFTEGGNPPCEKICEGSGLYPNEENPEVYYKCMKIGGQAKKVAFYCPENYMLKHINNEIGFMCVKSKKKEN